MQYSLITIFKKSILFVKGSIIVNFISGKAIFNGIEGKPAPAPTSHKLLLLKLSLKAIDKEL